MKKDKLSTFGMILLFALMTYAVSDAINSFSDGSTVKKFFISPNETESFFVRVPLNTNITHSNLTMRYYNGSVKYLDPATLFCGHNTSGSISFWINVTAANPTPNKKALEFGDNGFSACGFAGTTQPGNFTCYTYNNTIGAAGVRYVWSRMNSSKWYHVVYTYSNSTGYKLYVNGSLVNSYVTERVNCVVSSQGDRFGSDVNGNNDLLGYLADVQMYNRSLSASDVHQIFNNGISTITPIAYFDFEEFVNDYAFDQINYFRMLNLDHATSLVKFGPTYNGSGSNQRSAYFPATTKGMPFGDNNMVDRAFLDIGNNSIYELDSSFAVNISYISNNSAWNKVLRDRCNCTGCYVSGGYCNIPVTASANTTGYFELDGLNLTDGFNIGSCSDYKYPMVNYTIYDDLTGGGINVNVGYSMLASTGIYDFNLSDNLSNVQSFSICTDVNPNDNEIAMELSGGILLEEDGYATRYYVTEPGAGIDISNKNPVSQDLYLILLNQSSTVVFTWLTTTYQAIDGTMLIYRCEGNGTKIEIDSIPIVDSIASANLVLVNQPYAYEVVIDGVKYSDSTSYSKCHIETDTTREFLVDTGGASVSPTIGLYSIPCNLTRIANNTVKMQWGSNPEDSSTITGCMYAYRQAVTGTTQVYLNCSTVENPMTRTIPSSGFNYIVKGRLFQSGYGIDCADVVEFKSATKASTLFGLIGVFSFFIFLAGIVLLFSETGKKQVAGAAIGLVGIFILGFTPFGWMTVASLLLFFIIIIIIGRYSKQPG